MRRVYEREQPDRCLDRCLMDNEKTSEIETKIAELTQRFPKHSVPPAMWQELEDLEEELRLARQENSEDTDAG